MTVLTLCETQASFCPVKQLLLPGFEPWPNRFPHIWNCLIYIYIYKPDTHAHTCGGTFGQKMTGAVMWETETLYSAPGKEGRTRDGGSDGGRNVFGMPSLLPLTPPWSLSFCEASLYPAPLPSSPNPQRCTLAWNTGAHTLKFAWVCLCMRTFETAEQSRSVKQTDMHVRLPWIQHSGTPLLFFFSLTLTFLLFFYYCYFLILFEYFGS